MRAATRDLILLPVRPWRLARVARASSYEGALLTGAVALAVLPFIVAVAEFGAIALGALLLYGFSVVVVTTFVGLLLTGLVRGMGAMLSGPPSETGEAKLRAVMLLPSALFVPTALLGIVLLPGPADRYPGGVFLTLAAALYAVAGSLVLRAIGR